MILGTRRFEFTHKRVIDAVVLYERVSYWTIEGSTGIIDIFDREGKASTDHEVFMWINDVKLSENRKTKR